LRSEETRFDRILRYQVLKKNLRNTAGQLIVYFDAYWIIEAEVM